MKKYTGIRLDGKASVRVVEEDGEIHELNPRNDVRNHSPDGFEWGYGGSGPAQLALAILVDYFGGDKSKAEFCYQEYKWSIIANLPLDIWTITSDEIDRWLQRNVRSI